MELIEETVKKGRLVRRQKNTYIVSLNFGRIVGITDIGRKCFAVYVIINYDSEIVSAYPNPK